jgi:hypothetical protein
LKPFAFGLYHPSLFKIKIKIRFEDKIGLVLRQKPGEKLTTGKSVLHLWA